MTIINQHLTTTPKDERDLASTPWDLVSRLALVMNYTFVLDVCALPMSKRAPFFYGELEQNAGSVSANLFGSGLMTGMALGVVTNANGLYKRQQSVVIDDDEVLWLVTSAFMKIAA